MQLKLPSSLSGLWGPLQPTTSWRNAAVSACNARLEERLAQGESYQQIRQQDFEVIVPKDVWTGMHMFCSDYGITGGTHHAYQKHPVMANCQATTLVEPKANVPSPGNLQEKFVLNHVDLHSPQSNYQGVCPAQMSFIAKINSNGAGGNIQYRFLKDGQPLGAFQSAHIPTGNASFSIPYSLAVNDEPIPEAKAPLGMQANTIGVQIMPMLKAKPSHTLRIEVKTNQQSLDADEAYSYACKTPLKIAAQPENLGHADITALPMVSVGNQTTQWGGSVQLGPQDASAITPQGCQYRFSYTATNIGNAIASSSAARLKDGQNFMLHHQIDFTLPVGVSQKVSGMVTLKPGQQLLVLSLDDNKSVAESNEANNLFRLFVNVQNDCDVELHSTPRVPAMQRALVLPMQRQQ